MDEAESEQFTDKNKYEWRELSRWIKYEQTIDLETNVWGKPFVGALVYQSLLYLKTGLQYGKNIFKVFTHSKKFFQ